MTRITDMLCHAGLIIRQQTTRVLTYSCMATMLGNLQHLRNSL